MAWNSCGGENRYLPVYLFFLKHSFQQMQSTTSKRYVFENFDVCWFCLCSEIQQCWMQSAKNCHSVTRI